MVGLVRKVEELNGIFSDTGVLKGEPVQIPLRDNTEPDSVHTPRRIPVQLLHKVETELKRMEQIGITEKICELTAWCAPMVPVTKKNGKIQICVTFKRLNEAVVREKYLLPPLDHFIPTVKAVTIFSKLDASSRC
ncbi:unnamed protein product [Lepidochelys kempii]